MKILKNINSPHDLKQLSTEDLNILSKEIRSHMVSVVSETGGHLAPNLGVVELTLALHYTFDSPRDKIIWDVGHQCYVHKILTGRREYFSSLRQFKGLSGFPKSEESIHDAFNSGHSSTSISAGLGMALARDIRGDNYKIVPVIGDGALTGGMAFEALNFAGHMELDLIVVLNDNEMSISTNVGALSSYLNRIRTDPVYYRGKEEFESIIKRLPKIGSHVVKFTDRIKDCFKYLIVPGMLFEELGFTYLGPIDGHNITAINSVLKNAKVLKKPVIIHVITKKGKGYEPAEKNPFKFHGIGAFNKINGEGLQVKKNNKITYTETFGRTITELAKENERIVAITAAMPEGTGLNDFRKLFPNRFYDVGIAEQNAVTMAAGMAKEGFIPVVALYSTFLQRAYDQIIHDVCIQKLPVLFAVDRAGIVGADGETHQGLFDISFLRAIPNLTIIAPKDENELRQVFYSAFKWINGPIAVRYPRGEGVGVNIDSKLTEVPYGKSEKVKDGKDLLIIAVGPIVYNVLEVSNYLEEKGYSIAVVNARYIKPLDDELILELAEKIKLVLTVEEHVLAGGFGSSIMELISQNELNNIKISSLGIEDVFVEHGKPDELKEEYGIANKHIFAKAEQMLNSNVRNSFNYD